MRSQTITIPLKGTDSTSGILTVPDQGVQARSRGIVIAHGAANDYNNPLIRAVADGLADKGHACLRFNFLYRERNKGAIDPEHRLVLAWQRAIACMIEATGLKQIIAVGKSLGARIAAQATAAGEIQPERLIFLGYPLHAPGKKDRLRDAPLRQIRQPMLFFEGTRDPFCDLSLLDGVLKELPGDAALEIIENGDHSLDLPKSDPRDQGEIYRHVIHTCAGWI